MTTQKSDRMIVALHGPYGVGKDTVADALVTMLPTFKRIGFGDGVWEAVDTLLGLEAGESKDRNLKTCEQDHFCIALTRDPGYREWMQKRGFDPLEPRTSRFHAIEYGGKYLLRTDKLRWVKRAVEKMEEDPHADYVFSDLRTYEDFREYNGLAMFAALTKRHFLCVELTQEGVCYTSNPDNSRLPEVLIHATVPNDRGNLGSTMGMIVRHITQTREMA